MVLQDLRYAFRSLAKRPGFAVIAILTLSFGIGATRAIFSVVQAVLLRPLEYSDAHRLVKVVGFDTAEGTTGNLSPADFLDFQRDATSFARMGANGWVGLATISGGRGEAERAGWVQVTEGFFPTLRLQPAVGRGISADDDRRAASGVDQRRLVAPPLRRRSLDHRTGDLVQRHARHDHRRAARQLPAPRDQPGATRRYFHAIPLGYRAAQSRRSLHSRGRAIEGWPDARAGPRRARAD